MVNLTAAPHGKAILVAGDTKPVKEELKTLSGRWNGSLGGWIFPASKKEEILSELRKKHTVTEAGFSAATAGTTGVATSSTAAASSAATVVPSVDANASVVVVPHKKAILVTDAVQGSQDTKRVKETLKALGGSWNGSLGGWFGGQVRLVSCLCPLVL